MRLIDFDAFRKEHRLSESCNDCQRNARECQYNDFSLMDFCGWLDDAETVDAVPLEPLCEWLDEHAGRPRDCEMKPCGKCEYDKFGSFKECWKAILKKWMAEPTKEESQ